MKFVEIGDKLINLDNVTDITVTEDRMGIKQMSVRIKERRIRLTPQETKGFDRWLRSKDLIEEIKPGHVRYPSPDEYLRRIERERERS